VLISLPYVIEPESGYTTESMTHDLYDVRPSYLLSQWVLPLPFGQQSLPIPLKAEG